MSDAHRHFEVAVNAEALALAWARQESAPTGAVVTVDHEISPRGRLGRLWPQSQERTAVLAMVWRPTLRAEEADLVWAAASLGLLGAARALLGGRTAGTWWPETVVDASERRIGELRAEVQLGPGRVSSAVITARLDLEALPGVDRNAATTEMIGGLRNGIEHLNGGLDELRASYSRSCVLIGRRVTARMLPRGAVRGAVRGIDELGRLQLVSATGLVECVPVVSFDRIDIVT